MNHILLCHIRLCYILLCHILLHHIPMYHIVLDCIVFFCIVPFSISFCYIVLLLFFHIICYVTICVVQFISSRYYIELFCTLLNFYVIPSYRHLFPLEIIFVRWLQSSGEAMGLLAYTTRISWNVQKGKEFGTLPTPTRFFSLLLMLAKNTAEKVRWIWLSCNISTLAGPRWRTCGISQVLICGKVQRSMRFFFWMNEVRSFW